MTYDDEDTYTLSTGRTFYALNGTIGLSPDSDEPSYGADGSISTEGEVYTTIPSIPAWTPVERAELADAMIARWQAWKDRT